MKNPWGQYNVKRKSIPIPDLHQNKKDKYALFKGT